MLDEVRAPHLVLSHTCHVDGVGTGNSGDTFQHILRRAQAVVSLNVAQRVVLTDLIEGIPPGI